MSAEVFVDTNVLVYCRDASEPHKQPEAQEWVERLWRERRGRISTQVISEYYVTVTRKLSPGLSPDAARRELRLLLAWRPLSINTALIEEAWRIEERFQLSWWDAMIVAAARQSGCRWLLTEDLQDGQDLDGLVVVDPFAHSPDHLPGP